MSQALHFDDFQDGQGQDFMDDDFKLFGEDDLPSIPATQPDDSLPPVVGGTPTPVGTPLSDDSDDDSGVKHPKPKPTTAAVGSESDVASEEKPTDSESDVAPEGEPTANPDESKDAPESESNFDVKKFLAVIRENMTERDHEYCTAYGSFFRLKGDKTIKAGDLISHKHFLEPILRACEGKIPKTLQLAIAFHQYDIENTFEYSGLLKDAEDEEESEKMANKAKKQGTSEWSISEGGALHALISKSHKLVVNSNNSRSDELLAIKDAIGTKRRNRQPKAKAAPKKNKKAPPVDLEKMDGPLKALYNDELVGKAIAIDSDDDAPTKPSNKDDKEISAPSTGEATVTEPEKTNSPNAKESKKINKQKDGKDAGKKEAKKPSLPEVPKPPGVDALVVKAKEKKPFDKVKDLSVEENQPLEESTGTDTNEGTKDKTDSEKEKRKKLFTKEEWIEEFGDDIIKLLPKEAEPNGKFGRTCYSARVPVSGTMVATIQVLFSGKSFRVEVPKVASPTCPFKDDEGNMTVQSMQKAWDAAKAKALEKMKENRGLVPESTEAPAKKKAKKA